MTVKIARGIVVDSVRCDTVIVRAGSSIVLLAESGKPLTARFYSDREELFEVPVTEIVEIAP